MIIRSHQWNIPMIMILGYVVVKSGYIRPYSGYMVVNNCWSCIMMVHHGQQGKPSFIMATGIFHAYPKGCPETWQEPPIDGGL